MGIYADGADQPDKTVAGGAVRIDRAAGLALVGLTPRCEIPSLDYTAAGAGGEVEYGRRGRYHNVPLDFQDTGEGIAIGARSGGQDTVRLRLRSDAFQEAAPMFNGVKEVSFPGGIDLSARIRVMTTGLGPFHLRAICSEMEMYDK